VPPVGSRAFSTSTPDTLSSTLAAHQCHRLRQVRKLIEANDYNAALDVARQQGREAVRRSSTSNMDEGMLDSEAAMVRFLNLIAARAGYRPRSDHDRLVQVDGD